VRFKPKGVNIYISDSCQGPDIESSIKGFLSKALRGVTHHLTKPSRCGTAGKGKEHACLGLPDAFALEHSQGNHIPSPGAELRQGEGR
jgi:hypothetical protein